MSETKDRITITMAPELLREIDRLAEVRGEARSAVMEMILRAGIGQAWEMVEDLESPLNRALLTAFLKSDALMRLAYKVAGRSLPKEQLAELRQRGRRQVERGKERQGAKRGRGEGAGESGAGGFLLVEGM